MERGRFVVGARLTGGHFLAAQRFESFEQARRGGQASGHFSLAVGADSVVRATAPRSHYQKARSTPFDLGIASSDVRWSKKVEARGLFQQQRRQQEWKKPAPTRIGTGSGWWSSGSPLRSG